MIAKIDPWLLTALNAPVMCWWSWHRAVLGEDKALRFIRELIVTVPIPPEIGQDSNLEVSAQCLTAKTTTFVAGLRSTGIAAPFVLDGPINRSALEAYVEKVLVPELSAGDIDHGQPVEPQGATGARHDRGGRRRAPLPPALQPRL